MSSPSVTHKTYEHPGNELVLALVPPDVRRVLDVGCGTGGNAARLRDAGAEVDGVTLSEAEAAQARLVCREVWLHNLEEGLPDAAQGPYDAVVCSHVIEHLCFPSKLLNDARRVLKPGGVLVVALPNLLFWRYRLRLLAGRFEYESGGVMDDTHFRWYSFESAQRLLAEHGFEKMHAGADGALPVSFLRRIVPSALMKKVDAAVLKLWPGLFGWQMIFQYRRPA